MFIKLVESNFVNVFDADILCALADYPKASQRSLATLTDLSVGKVNTSLKSLQSQKLLDSSYDLTEESMGLLKAASPRQAVILAAGLGLRMLPINKETPKGLLEVRGDVLIERLIKQLHEAGVTDITVVVGFFKERFEYLIDRYNVRLIVNPDYAQTGSLYSLYLAREHLDNAYILPSDVYFSSNPFRSFELYSWYLLSEQEDPESPLRMNRKRELALATPQFVGQVLTGLAYFCAQDTEFLKSKFSEILASPALQKLYWDSVFLETNRSLFRARTVPSHTFSEINTFEHLRLIDRDSTHLQSQVLDQIAEALTVEASAIQDISVVKAGMTNRSFLFSCNNERFIMRLPGEGTDQLINRFDEKAVYDVIGPLHISDEVIFFDWQNGYKLTRYIENARVCDPLSPAEVMRCMQTLRSFHNLRLEVDHSFGLVDHIEFYERLREGTPSVYQDYEETKQRVLELGAYVDTLDCEQTLCHIDSVPDNFLLFSNELGQENIRIIDWEYAGMQDPHVDIAMFAVYSMYERPQIEQLIDAYFAEGCTAQTRVKIYCYIALCGLLWSNWCEVKLKSGVEFGQYSLAQYRFAKDYYHIVKQEQEKLS
jgi:CTP:phosphocholine cytidylyltransferase-like protein/thiamine kinase-like enzyme